MSISYWDWNATSSSGAISSNDVISWSGTASASSVYYTVYRPRPKTIYVKVPGHWGDDVAIAFARLVNIEVRTDYVVESIIKGDVLITDPDVEVRTMAEFLPLLKMNASVRDIQNINSFFIQNPLEARGDTTD